MYSPWQQPQINVPMVPGPIRPWGQVQQDVSGMNQFGRNLAANNPIPQYGGGYSQGANQQLQGNLQRALTGNLGSAGLEYQRMVAPANAQFQQQGESDVAQSGLRKAGYAQGRQRQQLQQGDQLWQMMMQILSGVMT